MIDKLYAKKMTVVIMRNMMKSLSMSVIDMGKLMSNFEDERSSILDNVLFKLWDHLMRNCKAYDAGKPLLVYEKALACLQRKGVDWNHLTLNMTNATISLGALNYFMRKEGASFSAGPGVPTNVSSHLPMRWVSLSGEDFADFMFEFDELVNSVIEYVDRRLHGIKIKSMQYEILCQTIEHLGEQYLKPHGIHWNVETNFTETFVPVSFNDKRHECISEYIPLDKLVDVFQAIPGRMERQSLPKVFKGYKFHLNNLVIDDIENIFPEQYCIENHQEDITKSLEQDASESI